MHVHIPSSHMTKEARRQLSREVKLEVKKEFMRTKIENAKRIDATLMLMLHNVFGFGRERLIRFHNAFVAEYDRLCEDYQDDGAEIAAIKLREATGIDIDELYKQEGLMDDQKRTC